MTYNPSTLRQMLEVLNYVQFSEGKKTEMSDGNNNKSVI